VVTLQVKNMDLKNTQAVMTDIQGKTIAVIQLRDISTKIDMSNYAPGVYLLKSTDGSVVKIIKN
jgi:Secretion system C-terminal sorting domain